MSKKLASSHPYAGTRHSRLGEPTSRSHPTVTEDPTVRWRYWPVHCSKVLDSLRLGRLTLRLCLTLSEDARMISTRPTRHARATCPTSLIMPRRVQPHPPRRPRRYSELRASQMLICGISRTAVWRWMNVKRSGLGFVEHVKSTSLNLHCCQRNGTGPAAKPSSASSL